MSTSMMELDPLVLPLLRGVRILDLGCGYGHWGHIITTHYRPEPDDPCLRADVVGVDIHAGNVDFARKAGTYREVIHCDAVSYAAKQASGSFDTVLVIDLIEHMPREDGLSLLSHVTRVASKAVILATPGFDNFRPGSNGITGFNEWEHHVSRWSVAELKSHGFALIGVRHHLHRQLYRVRGMYRLLGAFPWIEDCLHVLAKYNPRWAHTLLAWRYTAMPAGQSHPDRPVPNLPLQRMKPS